MKKLLALFLALTMVLGLAACSGSGTPAGTTAPAASSTGKDTTPADPTTSGEVSHIKLGLITLMTVPSAEATKNVENDINKYLKETLGISQLCAGSEHHLHSGLRYHHPHGAGQRQRF